MFLTSLPLSLKVPQPPLQPPPCPPQNSARIGDIWPASVCDRRWKDRKVPETFTFSKTAFVCQCSWCSSVAGPLLQKHIFPCQDESLKTHKNRPATMKNNLELYSVVTGGYRRLQERSDDFSLQTDRHFIIIYTIIIIIIITRPRPA